MHGELYARIVPRRSGAPPKMILLLHGIVSSGEQFGAEYDALAEHGDVIVPDLLGFGRSLDRRRRNFTLVDHLSAIDSLLRVTTDRGTRLVIAGHSLGGALALFVAAKHVERTEHVTAWGAPLHVDEASARVHIRRMGRMNALMGLDTPLARMTCTLICPRQRISGPLYRLVQREVPRPVVDMAVLHTWHSYIGAMRALILDTPWRDALETLAACATPVHVVAGSEDRVVDHPLMQQMAARHRSVRITTVAGAGHNLPIVNPTPCVEMIVVNRPPPKPPGDGR